ncbi:Uncharacterised protein [Delftia tsuruhatensis]|uniref:hypothetical protein n=1 Tax=Delftia tsuruhatensis TaxID=180282 RepID=UPI001E70B5F8|nr:hypothetical protein [Delftia tsuruhatensis]CAB5723372.1 Uncharacterised protein [Delftia tsuruhatensis]CAC9681205.1 Uncharacterised protein [Delftia tsuruhatensis]
MKRVSTAIMLVGIVMLILALGSDVAVDGMGGRRITNNGLMHDRLVNIILGVTLILGGLLLKLFGEKLSGPYLQAIDQLPASEYFARWATAILSSACVWVLLLMYLWPTTSVAAALFAAMAWCSFLPPATYKVLKRVWMGTLLLAVGMAAWHLIALFSTGVNALTLGLISEGVSLIGTGRLLPLFAVMLGVPLLVSIGGVTLSAIKSKRN